MVETRTSDSLTGLRNKHYVLLVAAGTAIGLGGFAIWYIRRKNARMEATLPPRAQIQLQKLEPFEPSSSTAQNRYGVSTPADVVSQPRVLKPDEAASKSGALCDQELHQYKGREEASTAGRSLPPYLWAQNKAEAYLVTTCPLDVRSKEITCKIQNRSLQLSVRGENVANGEFYAPVDSSESTWQLESMDDRKKLIVTLVKKDAPCSEQPEWPTLLKGSPIPALNTVTV